MVGLRDCSGLPTLWPVTARTVMERGGPREEQGGEKCGKKRLEMHLSGFFFRNQLRRKVNQRKIWTFGGASYRPFDSSKPESHDTSHAVSPPPARSRLNLTLAGNELRYQAAMRERKAAIQKIGGPNALSCDSTLCRINTRMGSANLDLAKTDGQGISFEGIKSEVLGAWSGRRQKRREEVLTAGDCQGGTTLIGRTARRRSRFEPQESQSELGGGKAAIRGCCAEFEVRANGVRAAKGEDASGGRSTAVTITASTLRRDEGRRARGVNCRQIRKEGTRDVTEVVRRERRGNVKKLLNVRSAWFKRGWIFNCSSSSPPPQHPAVPLQEIEVHTI
ncbi:hypothetical protein B0H13DRAFT_1887098 [Mycena leptocephala]|nr:hypothetical protein B0H13DRAFT_1887098 [Mycena leptocephala]